MSSALEAMYTKESTCGGFVETGDEFPMSDQRNADVSRGVLATDAYGHVDRTTANVVDRRPNWSSYRVRVPTTTTKEVTCGDSQYLGPVADVDCERNRKRFRQNSRYDPSPNYATLPSRCNSDRALQLAKRRKLHDEETVGQIEVGQMDETKRRKFVENLDVGESNLDETKLDVFTTTVTFAPIHQMEPWNRFPDSAAAADAWNSTGPEGDQVRGRFFRPVQPAFRLASTSESCPEEKERPIRASSKVSLTGSREAKENVASIHSSISRSSQQPNSDPTANSEYLKTDSNRRFIYDEYSGHLIHSIAYSPFATTSCLYQSFQPSNRNSLDKLKSENVCHIRHSISSSLSFAQSPRATVVSTDGATFQKDFPRVEIPDPRLAVRGQSDSWCKRESAENERRTWSAGMPFHHSEDLRAMPCSVAGQERIELPELAVLPSNMEEIKENVSTDSRPCHRNRYFGEHRFGHRLRHEESQIAKGGESTRGEWRKTSVKPCQQQQGLPESSLGELEPRFVFGNVLDHRGPEKYSHLERSSHTDSHAGSCASRQQFTGAAAGRARDAANRTRCEMPERNDRSDADMTSSRRWTSNGYGNGTFQNGRTVHSRQTILRAKSLSPSLMSNVGSGNFGSLESIRAYYKTMGRLTKSSSSSSSNSSSSSSSRSELSSSQNPKTDTNGPIDLSRRVQIRQRYDITQTNSPSSVASDAHCCARASTSGNQAPGDISPRTGSSVDAENYRQRRDAVSVSLPNSRIGSPSPDSHLPPKKRRYPSYEWLATSGSTAAGEGNDGGMLAEDDTVKSAGRAVTCG